MLALLRLEVLCDDAVEDPFEGLPQLKVSHIQPSTSRHCVKIQAEHQYGFSTPNFVAVFQTGAHTVTVSTRQHTPSHVEDVWNLLKRFGES